MHLMYCVPVNALSALIFISLCSNAGATMRSVSLLLIPILLLVLALPVSRGRYNDDFDDGEDIADFDDNDFAEFEDMNDDLTAEAETAPPPRVSPSSRPEEDEDEDEATVELEDGQDGFEDPETQVHYLFITGSIFQHIIFHHINLFRRLYSEGIQCYFTRIKTYEATMTWMSLRGLETWIGQPTQRMTIL